MQTLRYDTCRPPQAHINQVMMKYDAFVCEIRSAAQIVVWPLHVKTIALYIYAIDMILLQYICTLQCVSTALLLIRIHHV